MYTYMRTTVSEANMQGMGDYIAPYSARHNYLFVRAWVMMSQFISLLDS